MLSVGDEMLLAGWSHGSSGRLRALCTAMGVGRRARALGALAKAALAVFGLVAATSCAGLVHRERAASPTPDTAKAVAGTGARAPKSLEWWHWPFPQANESYLCAFDGEELVLVGERSGRWIELARCERANGATLCYLDTQPMFDSWCCGFTFGRGRASVSQTEHGTSRETALELATDVTAGAMSRADQIAASTPRFPGIWARTKACLAALEKQVHTAEAEKLVDGFKARLFQEKVWPDFSEAENARLLRWVVADLVAAKLAVPPECRQ